MRLDIFQRNDCRFLHHVAQVSCQGEFGSLALAERGFYEEDFSSYRCPCQSCYHTGILVALVDVACEDGLAQQLFHLGRSNGRLLQLVGICQFVCHLSQSLVDSFLELAYSALACVMVYQVFDGRLGKLYLWLILVETRILQLAWHQVSLGYLHFLLDDVSAHFDELHTVEQRTWNTADIVGSSNEEHLRQIVVSIEIIVVEGIVLFWVEHFEQSRCRVSVDGVLCHLVYLVEDEYRVAASCLLNVLDDLSGHGSYIGAAMSSYLRLVVQAAQ